MDVTEDKILLYYINQLREIAKQKKHTMKIVDGKPVIEISDIDPIENQIRENLNNHLKKNYPHMAYFPTARVKVKSIPDNCGLENKGTIIKSDKDERLVRLDNGKEYQYKVDNLELLLD